jgi:hypothetical protein
MLQPTSTDERKKKDKRSGEAFLFPSFTLEETTKMQITQDMTGPRTGEKQKRKHHLPSKHQGMHEESARPPKSTGPRRPPRSLPGGGAVGCRTNCPVLRSGVQRQRATSTLILRFAAHRDTSKPNQAGVQVSTERGEQREREIMELCVSTTASVRATAAPISFAPPRRGASASTALPLHRRIPTRGTA